MRICIPDGLAKELLNTYGTIEHDEDGHIHEFTQQDIYEQLRGLLYSTQ